MKQRKISLNSIIDYDEARRRYLRTGRFQPYIMPIYPVPAIQKAARARAPRVNPLQFAFNNSARGISDAEMNAAYDAAMSQMRAPASYSLVPSPAQQRINNARIGGYLGIEKKYIDNEFALQLGETLAGSEKDPASGALNAIAQGDGPSDRDGRQVTLKSVHIRGQIKVPSLAFDPSAPGAQGTGFSVKFVLLLDTQTNGAQFNAEDVFVDPTDVDLDAFTFRNLQYQKRFRVLKDLMIPVPPATMSPAAYTSENNTPTTENNGDITAIVAAGRSVPFEVNHEFKGTGRNELQTIYTGNAANVSTISDNSLHVMALVSETLGVTAVLQYVSRVRFVG